jgi:hypothetical protein
MRMMVSFINHTGHTLSFFLEDEQPNTYNGPGSLIIWHKGKCTFLFYACLLPELTQLV